MKKHSSKNPNRVYQFTLTKQGEKILEAFAAKYGTTKSVIIDRALMFLAGQYHRKIVVSYELLTEEDTTTTTTTEELMTKYENTKKKPSVKTDDEDTISDEEMDLIKHQVKTMKTRAKMIENGTL